MIESSRYNNLQNILGRAGIMPFFSYHVFMVRVAGFEPAIFCSQSRRIEPDFPTLGNLVVMSGIEPLTSCV